MRKILFAAGLSGLLSCMLFSCSVKNKADLIVFNGIIYTVDSAFTVSEAMAVSEGRIVAVGTTKHILDAYEAIVKKDLEGLPVYPGFIDAHCHFFYYGCQSLAADFTGSRSFDEVIERVVAFSKTNKFPWILGRGWDQNDWEVKKYPTRQLLDSLFPNTPVVLSRVDGHAVLCNEAALNLAHITPQTKVSGGEILVEKGKLTGILIDNATALVQNRIPPYSEALYRDALLYAQKNCFAAGLTTVSDAGLGKDSILLIDKMQQEALLKIRVYAMVSDVEESVNYYLEKGPYKTERLDVRSIKMYGDGALGSRGACLLRPYSDTPKHSGFLLCDTAHMMALAQKAYDRGFQLNTHCIGDSAIRTVLNVYASVLKGKNQNRWRIEHSQVVNADDFDKYGAYDVIPSVQPTHATSDMYWAESRLGKERLKNAYAYEQLRMAAGGRIAYGTDFPVENISPLLTFYAATARKDLKGFPSGGFQAENKTSRENTLRAMTSWAAYAAFEETEKGSLEPGSFADFVILDKDLMKIPLAGIPTVQVVSTYVGGEKVYGK